MGTPLPKTGADPQFSANFYCGQTAGCIKMPLGMEVGFSPGDFMLEGDPIFGPCLLWPNGCMYQDTTWHAGKSQPRRYCVRWGRSSPSLKGHSPQFLANVRCGLVAKRLWTKMPLGMDNGGKPRPRRLCVWWGPSSAQKEGHSPHPIFGPCLLWPNGWMDGDATLHGSTHCWPRRHCVRRGPSSPRKGYKINSPPLFGPCLLWPRSPISATAVVYVEAYTYVRSGILIHPAVWPQPFGHNTPTSRRDRQTTVG